MIKALLGRFFRHCIAASAAREARVQVDQFRPEYMTDGEISDFLHGRPVDFSKINARRDAGLKIGVAGGLLP